MTISSCWLGHDLNSLAPNAALPDRCSAIQELRNCRRDRDSPPNDWLLPDALWSAAQAVIECQRPRPAAIGDRGYKLAIVASCGNVCMKAVTIREAKNRLTELARAVERGETIVVTRARARPFRAGAAPPAQGSSAWKRSTGAWFGKIVTNCGRYFRLKYH